MSRQEEARAKGQKGAIHEYLRDLHSQTGRHHLGDAGDIDLRHFGLQIAAGKRSSDR